MQSFEVTTMIFIYQSGIIDFDDVTDRIEMTTVASSRSKIKPLKLRHPLIWHLLTSQSILTGPLKLTQLQALGLDLFGLEFLGLTIDLHGIKLILTSQRSRSREARYGCLIFVKLEWRKEIQRMIYASKYLLLEVMAWLPVKWYENIRIIAWYNLNTILMKSVFQIQLARTVIDAGIDWPPIR